jgi:hypothetical protein
LPFSRRASRSPDPDSRLLAPPHRAANSALLAGKDLLHLQCHFGLDTLSWARRGARVTGSYADPDAPVEAEPGIWRLPEPDDARLPLLYSLKATKA